MSETTGARVLLINPPLWNPYAPHLAVPLLLAVLRRNGVAATAMDLSAETMRHLLSRRGAVDYAVERPALQRALPARRRDLFDAAVESVDRAAAFLRSPESVDDTAGHRAATAVCRTVLEGVAALTPGATLGFDRFDLRYRPSRSREVVRATDDPVHNPYLPVFERVLVPRLRRLPDLELVGLSVSADSQLVAAMTAARLIRRERPDVHITLGGNFVTRVAPRLRPGHPFFGLVDSIVQYEGEEPIVELARRVGEGRSLRGVPGVLVPAEGHLHSSPAAMADLADLPVPDFTDHPLADGYLAPGPVLPLIASRSCAWECAFCAIPFASNKFRIREPGAVVAEMDEQFRRHGISDFQFVDEILTVRSLRGLVAPLRERDYRWYGETRFSAAVDRRLTDALYAAGCRRLDLGLESYNQDVLDRMRKGVRTSWIGPNLDALLGSGISVHLFCIAGFPGEARWQTARTVEFATRTVARSREEYGVPDSTFGIGPFVLDALSPVAMRPEDFEVRVLHPDPAEDLQMELRYDFVGEPPEPVEPLEKDVAARAEAILGGSLDDPDRPPEEVVFLRSRHPGRRPDPVPDVPCLTADWDRQPLRVAAGWVTARRTGERTVLYEPGRAALVSLPTRLVEALPAPAAEVAGGAADLTLLRTALHHGCLEPADPTARQRLAAGGLTAGAEPDPGLLLSLAPGVTVEHGPAVADGTAAGARLACAVTGRRLRLSPSGLAVAAATARRGELSLAELVGMFRPAARPRVTAFVRRLLTTGLLSARSPDRSRLPLVERG